MGILDAAIRYYSTIMTIYTYVHTCIHEHASVFVCENERIFVCLVNIPQNKSEYQVIGLTHQIYTVSPSGLMAEEYHPTTITALKLKLYKHTHTQPSSCLYKMTTLITQLTSA